MSEHRGTLRSTSDNGGGPGSPDAGKTDRAARSVLFLIGAQNFGGAERQLVTLAKGLGRNGHRVAVAICYPADPIRRELRDTPVKLVELDRRGRWGAIGFFRRAVMLVRQESPMALHGYLNGPNLLTVILKFLGPRTRVVWGIRASNMDLRSDTLRHRIAFQLNAYLSRFADLIIANSVAGAEYHRLSGYPSDRMVVVQNGIDTDRFRPDPGARQRVRAEWGIRPDELLVGLPARLHAMKDHPTFLRAAALVVEADPNVRFACVGTGEPDYTSELEALSRSLGLENRVSWVGHRDDMVAVYNAFDVVCSSSAFGEGFSNTISEAMACGVPCVVTDVGDSARIVEQTGTVVAPGDVQGMADGLVHQLNASPSLRSECRRRIEDHFSVDRLVERTEALLWPGD